MKKLNELLEGVQSVAIGGHVKPDGDCTGSCIGLYGYILENYPEISVDVFLEEIPESYTWIKRTECAIHEANDQIYDLFLALDCGDKARLGFSGEIFDRAKKTYCVDHHISNTAFAMDQYVRPQASSASELIFDMMEEDKISLTVAEALYLGIVHDTGVFQYSCCSPKTFHVAAKLLEKGVDAPSLITDTYFEKTYTQNRILGKALDGSRLIDDGRYIASYLTMEDMKAYGASSKDIDGIVAQLRITKGVEVSIFLYEQKPGVYKLSMRSKNDMDVAKVAGYFGGGGHVKAAGATVEGDPEDIIRRVTEQLRLQVI